MQEPPNPQQVMRIRTVLAQAIGFGGLWWLLSDSSLASWIVGAPTVTGAVYTSVMLRPVTSPRTRILGVLRLFILFLRESVRGGVTVALRAFQPRLSFAPVLVEYPVRLPDNSTRVLFANIVSLLPGTLSAMFHDDHLTVHALDGDPTDITAELRSLEQVIAGVYGLTLPMQESLEETPRV